MFLKRFQLKGLAHENAEVVRMTEEEVKTRSASGATVVDVRLGIQFSEGHFPGSLNIGLASRMFTTCAGVFLTKQSQILLVVERSEDATKTHAELVRAGFERVVGFIEAAEITELHQLTQLSVFDLNSTLSRGGKPAILDVRSTGEWRSSGIAGSINIPLAQLATRFLELSLSHPLVVVCQNGYQSAMASSWLQANGFDSVHHLLGGMDAYTGASYECVETSRFSSFQSGSSAC